MIRTRVAPAVRSSWTNATAVSTAMARPFSTRSETVPLVFDLHEPARPSTDQKTSPILFMHGLFGSKKNNRSISKALARDLGRYVYALDLRNHGESPHHPEHNYSSMAADVAEFIHRHSLKDATLIGHSMGAKTAMTLALQQPDLVADIVSVDNAPVDARLESEFARYVQGMKKIDEADVTRLAEADKILAPYEANMTIRQFLLGNLHRPEGAGVQKFRFPIGILGRALDHMGDFPFNDPEAAQFKKPTLFVRGTKSRYVPDEVIPTIGRFFPRFELVDIDAGHWVISEKPEDFRQAVVQFLSPKE